jgi:hypothetical protein
MTDYTPTPYDLQLEALIGLLGRQIVRSHTDGFAEKTYDQRSDAIAPYLARQKLLHCARSPEYIRFLEKHRGLV